MNREAAMKAALELLVEKSDAGHGSSDEVGAYCVYCGAEESLLDGDWDVRHKDDCPIAIGRKVLADLKADDEVQAKRRLPRMMEEAIARGDFKTV